MDLSFAYLSHGILNDLLVRHITLVSHKQFVDTLGGISVDFLEPLLDIVERFHIRYVVNHADTMGSAVV